MRRPILPTVALVLVLAAPAGAAEKITEYDRFSLWTGCAPVAELIGGIDGAVGRLTLDQRDIATAVRSRLRAARIFDETGLWLVVNVTVSGPAFSVDVKFTRSVEVRPKGTRALVGMAATWEAGSTGTHSNNPSHILSSVSRHVDKFIDEYLRVNADTCRNSN